MCGIFGVVVKSDSGIQTGEFKLLVDRLFELSETRGKEAAGLAFYRNDTITVLKHPVTASHFIKLNDYSRLFDPLKQNSNPPSSLAAIGHSRLVTNGMQSLPENNQPVIKNGLVGIHNGIVVNDAELWAKHTTLKRTFDVDSEVILSLIHMLHEQGASISKAVADTFGLIEGEASIAAFSDHANSLVLATNNGSLYFVTDPSHRLFLFASEHLICQKMIADNTLRSISNEFQITQIRPGEGYIVNFMNPAPQSFSLNGDNSKAPTSEADPSPKFEIVDLSFLENPERVSLKRCLKCILPETFPFIDFDKEGVCYFCRTFRKTEPLGIEALEKQLSKYKRKPGGYDCLMGLSGGRDSCYGLHYAKKVLKMNPVVFTYDWGMVTDLARRNQSRMCGRLGVEHIMISADIKKKREHIRSNILAWLKRPDLGMIPLFLAGDKQLYYHSNQLMKQMDIPLLIFSENAKYERAFFKQAYTGVKYTEARLYSIPLKQKIRQVSYYLKQYFLNPAYINGSLFEAVSAYYCSYFLKHDYLYLFDYIPWREEEVNSTLIEEYGWELSEDTTTTWRIGDGSVAFYNYIYYTVAGFTENDAFRSNQIRDGAITREKALERVALENKPRWKSLEWYAHTVGFDLDEALRVIHSIPKHYH